jgi:NAD(P)-dependent dehydrogenase (short-subunit alcohol dehydrogenase family)
MADRVCIVSGTTSGHGKGVAMGVAQQGVHLVMVCRDKSKGEIIKEEIERATGSRAIDVIQTDLSSLASVKALAELIQKRYKQVNILVNNAGVYKKDFSLSGDGIEETFAVNYLASFLLTRELLGLLKASAPARVVNVTSSIHKKSTFGFEEVIRPRKYNGARAYRDSKLAIVCSTLQFAGLLQKDGVTVNCLTPGPVRSEIIRDFKLARFFWKLIAPFLPNEEKGAQPAVRLALAQDLAGVTGKYFEKLNEATPGAQALNPQFRQSLFDKSNQLVDSLLSRGSFQ